MHIDIQRSEERGKQEHGWLYTRHSFSFANYYNPKRMNFGLLRVLNDDIIEADRGFGEHPHDNMEIVTIVLQGSLEHTDSSGGHGVIKSGEVQHMSAGTGVVHSEFNHSKTEPVHLLQIWIEPKEHDIVPVYEQKSFAGKLKKNVLVPVVSGKKQGNALLIHQDAVFLLGELEKGKTVECTLQNRKHGVYVFVIDGELTLGKETLSKGDAAAITETETIALTATKEAKVLVIEVPLS